MKTKLKTFFYHYNKPRSQQEGTPIISLHYEDKCHFLTEIVVKVPTQSKINNRQPRFVMRGRCAQVVFEGRKATVS